MLFTLIKILLTYTNLQSIFNYNITIYSKLQGKYGIFRQNLLGFRVDYSGRAVIISSPDLYLDSIGLPITMLKYSLNNIIFKDSNKISEEEIKIYYNSDLLNLNLFNNLNKFSFIVNRAPTLHKMNTQSFYPMFTEGRAIKFMPILCVGYNADFDGDQMGVFSILFNSSLLESLNTLRPIVNLLSSTNKKNILNLTQGALLGLNILSIYNYFNFIKYYIINNYTTLIELNTNNILINTPLLLRYNYYFYLTTIGRSLLNIKLIK
ncbi:beta and beta-prime subunits of DNA dependent RNA-polymerase like protein (apicoplast) [Babesia gibsoni]|nr:beta and beta-prime subunits of DNA dependent RNA-polymerase like protein [Babesia gibsoni]